MKTSVVCQIRMPSLFHSRSVFALEGEYLLIGDNDLLPIGYPVVAMISVGDSALSRTRGCLTDSQLKHIHIVPVLFLNAEYSFVFLFKSAD